MISQADLDSFAEHEKTAQDFVERSQRKFPDGTPMPSDRWVTSADGMRELAAAVDTLLRINRLYGSVIIDMTQAQIDAGMVSMSLGPKRRD